MVDRTIGIIASIIMLAALSVIISKKSNAAQVIEALLSNIRKLIATAVSPVTG